MRPINACIDLNALVCNCTYLRSLAPQSKFLACVKANAYGHGASECALSLSAQVDAFGVCSLEEACQLREAKIDQPIVLLEGVFSFAEIAQAQDFGCDMVIRNQKQLDWLCAYLDNAQANKIKRLWVKVNTGMNRLGFKDKATQVVDFLLAHDAIQEIVVMTHLHSANADKKASQEQIASLQSLVANNKSLATSWCNSAALLQPELRGGDWMRSGIALYGGNSLPNKTTELVPVMSFMAEIIDFYPVESGQTVGYGATWQAPKDSLIAIVAAGYADGYPRQCSSKSFVLVRGERCAVIGLVSMDMLAIDVSSLAHVEIGDKVELWGKNISASNLAEIAGTIDYHLFTGVSGRVMRSYS